MGGACADKKSTQAPHADPYGVGERGIEIERAGTVDALESLAAATVLPPRGGQGRRARGDEALVSHYELDSYRRCASALASPKTIRFH